MTIFKLEVNHSIAQVFLEGAILKCVKSTA